MPQFPAAKREELQLASMEKEDSKYLEVEEVVPLRDIPRRNRRPVFHNLDLQENLGKQVLLRGIQETGEVLDLVFHPDLRIECTRRAFKSPFLKLHR